MSVVATSRLSHEQIKPKIGSRVLNRKDELLSGTLAKDIRELLEQRGVLVFPEIHFDDEEQIAFTRTLGTFQPERLGGDVFKITLDTKENPHSAEYLKGSLFYYEPEPSLAKLKGMQSVGERELPLVWKHRSGRKSLVPGCTAHS